MSFCESQGGGCRDRDERKQGSFKMKGDNSIYLYQYLLAILVNFGCRFRRIQVARERLCGNKIGMLRVKSAIQKRLLSTFGNQTAVPKLPVPSIDNLKIKYLKSLQPVITNQKQLQTSNKVVEAFFEPGKGKYNLLRMESLFWISCCICLAVSILFYILLPPLIFTPSHHQACRIWSRVAIKIRGIR